MILTDFKIKIFDNLIQLVHQGHQRLNREGWMDNAYESWTQTNSFIMYDYDLFIYLFLYHLHVRTISMNSYLNDVPCQNNIANIIINI